MVDPVIIGAGVTLAAITSAAAYAKYTGNEASVDTDGDGEDELTFGGNNGFDGCNDPTEDPAYRTDGPFVEELEDEDEFETEEPPEDPTPDHVAEIEDITDVKGVGATRADDLADAGFESAADLYYAADENLTDVDGIGEYTVEQIREDIGSVEAEGNGESSEEAEEASQDSTDQDEESQQSSSSDEATDEAAGEDDGSDSGEETDSTGNESDE